MTQTKKAVLALIIANIIWGASFPIYKLTLTDIPPFTFLFLRFFFGAIVLLPFVAHKLKIQKKDWPFLGSLSFFGITFTISFLFLGLQLSSSLNAPIIFSSGPVFLLIFAHFFLHRKIKPKVIYGTLLGLAGVSVIILRPLFESGFNASILGSIFLLIATIGGVIHTLHLKEITKHYSALVITFWSFLLGIIPITPLLFLELRDYPIQNLLQTQSLLGLGFAIFLATSLAHALNGFGIKTLQETEVGIFAYIDPIATALVAMPLLGEQITEAYLIGAVLVFLGIFISKGRLQWHPLNRLFSLFA